MQWVTDRFSQNAICNIFRHPQTRETSVLIHDDVIKWKHFPRNWPFVWGIHRSPVNSPLTGQWRGALKFSLIYVWIKDRVNNREAGDLRHYRLHYDVIVMYSVIAYPSKTDWHKLISITRQPQQSEGSFLLENVHLENSREHYIANLPTL